MKLTEKHTIKKGTKYYKILDAEAYKSKNLYNATLYAIRQRFFKDGSYLNYNSLQQKFQTEGQTDYYAMPTKVSQQTMKMADQNFRAFFKAVKEYKKSPAKFSGRPKLPKYLDKSNGRYLITYTYQSISKKVVDEKHMIKLSGIDVFIPTRVTYDKLLQVRVVHKVNSYVVEVVYDNGDNEPEYVDNGKYAAIDLGVSNFATITSNIKGFKPFVIDGRGAKSINRYYNKELSRLKSILKLRNKTKKGSKMTKRLTEKRNARINDFLHKSSRIIVNRLVSDGICTLVVGYNKNWKQDTKMNKHNNQNFVQLPYERFLFMLRYKCAKEGINLMTINESHTSKCSFLDCEEVCHHESYVGKRIKRGLFRSKNGCLINADVNGSYNILVKCMPKAFNADGVGDVLVHPGIIKIPN